MKNKLKLFTKKAISCILALAVILTSVISTISVFAASAPYKVSYGSPAIPMFVDKAVDLYNIEVQFTNGGNYVDGDSITWGIAEGTDTSAVTFKNEHYLVANATGIHTLTATANGSTKNIYVVVNNEDDYDFYLANVDLTGGLNLSDWSFYSQTTKLDVWEGGTTAYYTSNGSNVRIYRYNSQGFVDFFGEESAHKGNYMYMVYNSDLISEFADYTISSDLSYNQDASETVRSGFLVRGDFASSSALLLWYRNGYGFNAAAMNSNSMSGTALNSLGDNYTKLLYGGEYYYTKGTVRNLTTTVSSGNIKLSVNNNEIFDSTKTIFNYDGSNNTVHTGFSDDFATNGTTNIGVVGFVNVSTRMQIRNFSVKLNVFSADDMPEFVVPKDDEVKDIYNVSYDYPAILMNEDTKVDLASLAVQLTENGDYVLGTQINWSVDAANNAVVLNNTKKFVAVTDAGTYPIRATYGDDTKIFWLVAKKANETDFYLVNDNYANGDSGNWIVFSANSDNVFEKTDKTVADYGSYLGMHPGSSINMYLYNQPALLDFADYTVEMDAQTRLGNRTDANDPFWSYFGLVGRSKADASQHFTLVLRGGYGINFMCDKPALSLVTASITNAPHYFHYHSFHTLSSGTERAKLFPTTDEGGTGEYTDYGDTDRDIYTAKYMGSNVLYSYNNVAIFDSTSETFYDEAVKYELMDTEPSLSNPNVVSTANFWATASANLPMGGGYAGVFTHNHTNIDLYKFSVKLPTNKMAPASPYYASQDKVEMIVDESFDENNIILNFGVVSDTHISGGWHQEESSAKWAHTLKTLQQMAKDEGREKLDAILINGDMVDAFAGTANISTAASYGTKAYQNWLEAKYLTGAVHGTYGEGLDKGTQLFYSLGNHDETGMGWARLENKGYNDVHTAAYYLATLCGWEYAYKDDPGKDKNINDNLDNSYMDFADTLIAYHNDKTTDVSGFEATYGVAFEDAYEAFLEYFGRDTDLDETNGLLAGNRHMEIGGIHFLAVELSQSDVSCAWADAILARITAEDPDKPVFMLTHVKLPSETMPGVEAGEHHNLQAVVQKYPQVIIWGGHSHSYLHNDSAIETINGYTQVESATTEYVSQGDLTYSGASKHSDVSAKVQNLVDQHSHMFSNGCYVEVDADYNVRIRRIDLYQSYSNDYKSEELFINGEKLYSSDIFTKYGTGAYDAKWSDTYAEIRTPWIISAATRADTDTLKGYTEAKRYNNTAPEFASDKSLIVNGSVGAVNVNFIMNAEDDGMIHNYTVELYKTGSNEVLQSYQYTNYFYLYDNSVAGDIPVISQSLNFTGLEKGVNYTVKLYAMDDYGVTGEPIVKSAETIWGKETKVLEDGRIAVFLDTTKSPYVYTDEDGGYLTMASADIALGYNPDVIYFIEGIINRNQVVDYTNGLEIIGINANRAKTIFSLAHLTEGTWPYNTKVLQGDLTLKNITIDVPGTSEGTAQSAYASAFFYGNSDFVLDDVTIIPDASGYGIQLSAVKNEKVTPGSLTIKGDTGPLYRLGFSAFSYWGKSNNYVDGDMTVNLESGTYNEAVGYPGSDTYSSINGNLFLNISGGTYSRTVSMLGGKTVKSANTNAVMKNAVARISGGTFNASTGYGQMGAVYIEGREVIIIANNMLTNDTTLKNGKPLTLTSSDTVLIKADDVNYVGDAIFDANGIIIGFAVKQRLGYDSYVNGVAATEIAVVKGGNYTVTYVENGKAGLLGSDKHASAITNNTVDFALSDDIAYYEKYQIAFSDANWVINPSSDYAYANGILVPLKTGVITVSGSYNGIAFSNEITVKEFDAARNSIVNNSKLSIVKDGESYILKVAGKMRYDTLTVNGKRATGLDEVVDGIIKSGTQYVLNITDLTTLTITAKFEYDNADVSGVVYALGATIPENREDISIRFVNRAPGIKKTETGISLSSTVIKGGVEYTAVDIGSLLIPEVLLDGSELKFKDINDYKNGESVELVGGQTARNVVISVLNDATALYSDYAVLLSGMSENVAGIKDLQIAIVSYIVYKDANGNMHIEYTGDISRSYNDIANSADGEPVQSVQLSAQKTVAAEDKKLIAEFKKATFTI